MTPLLYTCIRDRPWSAESFAMPWETEVTTASVPGDKFFDRTGTAGAGICSDRGRDDRWIAPRLEQLGYRGANAQVAGRPGHSLSSHNRRTIFDRSRSDSGSSSKQNTRAP